MIYIVTATYAEAHAFLTHFQLKKDTSHTHFQVFLNKGQDICLIISGTGQIPAAVAVSSICTEYGAGQGDFLINAGICAGILNKNAQETDNLNQTGKIFLCHKIREQTTGKTFYPDILYRHEFTEAQVVTGAKPYAKTDQSEVNDANFYLYDMEAAAVYQAGSYYLGPHQMSFLKIISDHGNPENVSSSQIEGLIGQNMESISGHITRLQAITCEDRQHDPFQEEPVQEILEKLCRDMHCSRTMSESVRQHIRYCIFSGVDYVSAIDGMYRNGRLPCKDKREGKQCLEELKKRLL